MKGILISSSFMILFMLLTLNMFNLLIRYVYGLVPLEVLLASGFIVMFFVFALLSEMMENMTTWFNIKKEENNGSKK